MSIFQAQEWWATSVGSKEEFHTNSIDIGNVDNADPPMNKIIVGSFEGILRIFTPQPRQSKTEDLLIEKDMKAPILQVACWNNLVGQAAHKIFPDGKGKDKNAIAVLHSRKLVISAIVN